MPEADSAKASPTAGTVPHTNDNSSSGLIKPPQKCSTVLLLESGAPVFFFTALCGEDGFARSLSDSEEELSRGSFEDRALFLAWQRARQASVSLVFFFFLFGALLHTGYSPVGLVTL